MRSSVAGRVFRNIILSGCAVALFSGCGDADRPPTMPTARPAVLSESVISVSTGAASVSTILSITSAESVALSARAAEGIFVSFSPAVVPAGTGTSTVSVGVSSVVAAGTYAVVILAARAAGVTDTVTLTVTVAAAPLTGSAVTLDYCAADAPIWLAVQDGSTGSWTRIAPNSGSNTYQFRITSPLRVIGIASVDTVGTGYQLRVTYASDGEMTGISQSLGLGECESIAVTGTFANAGTPTTATVALAHRWRFLESVTSDAFTLSGVAAAPQDLIATRVDPLTRAPDKLILRRGLTVGAGGVVPVLDFNAAEAFVPGAGTVTLSGLNGDSAVVTTAFLGTGGRANGQIGLPAVYPGTDGTVPFFAVPLARLGANELQALTVIASAANTPTRSRSTTVYFREPGVLSVAMAPALNSPFVTRLSPGPNARARVRFATVVPYSSYMTAAFTQSTAGRAVTILGTYRATPVTPQTSTLSPWDFSIPDLSGAVGWDNSWGLMNGAPIAWSVTAAGGRSIPVSTNVGNGALLRTETRSGVLPAP